MASLFQETRLFSPKRLRFWEALTSLNTEGIRWTTKVKRSAGSVGIVFLLWQAYKLIDEPEHCETEELCVPSGPHVWRIQETLPPESELH